MLFANDLGDSLDFEIVGYEFENISTKELEKFNWDANWLVVKIVYDIDDYKQEFYSSCLLTTELLKFTLDLKKLKNNEINYCELDTLEPNLKINAKKDESNYIFSIEFIYNKSTGDKLKFIANLSKNELNYVYEEMEKLSNRFKVR